MYTGKIYRQNSELTVEQAVSLNLIDVDVNGDIWLKQDASHVVKITGDLYLE